jgi:HAD superfamily hydrolase (TIGR01450 family)
MKAIILAAGIGSRLQPMTNKKPKTLIKVNNKPMIGYIIDSLYRNGIENIVICTGFETSQIVNFCKNNYSLINFNFVENKEFEDTNNMYSLFLAKKYLDDDIILMNADLVFDAEIIKGLIEQEGTCVAADKGNYIEESMKVIVKNGIINNISKKISEKDAYGCSIDIYKIDKEDTKFLVSEMENIIEKQGDKNQWTEVMLDNLFSAGKIIAKPFNIDGKKWYEIDNYQDLSNAEIIFNESIKKIRDKKIFFIDRDGTLTLGKSVIKGAIEFLNSLKREDKYFFVATNNSSITPKEHLDRFNKLGLGLKEDNILVSSSSALSFLKQNDFNRIFWVANKNVSNFFEKEGLIYDEKNPQAILLTYDDEINYDKLKKLTNFVRFGVPYYATHSDIVCPTDKGPIPDIGTFIKIIEMTTGILPNKIFGKPDKSFIDPILKKYNLSREDAVIIGDRLYTDIKLAEDSNITSILVLTGETKREDYEDSTIRSNIIVSSFWDLINIFENEN